MIEVTYQPTIIEPKKIDALPEVVINDTPKVEEKPEITATHKVSQEIPLMNLHRLSQYFEITNPTNLQDSQMKVLYNYFEQQGISDMDSLLKSILKLETLIGTAPFGISRLGHLANYIKVLSQIGQLEHLKTLMQQ